MRKLPTSLHRAAAARLSATLCLALLAGCGGHGDYTKQHIDDSQERLAQLKSGTEWQMAQQQFLAGDLDKAAKTIDKSLALNPKVPKSHVLKGRILMEKGQLEQARMCFLEAEKLEPTTVDAQYYLGIVHERFSEPQLAFDRYSKAIELDSTNPQYVVAASDMLVQLDQLDDAEKFLHSKRSNFEYNSALRQSLGNISMLRGDFVKATGYYDEARLLAPDDMQVLEDLVRAQIASINYADAESNIRKLLASERYASRRDLRHQQAKCLIALNRPVEARQLLIELTSDTEGGNDIEAWVDLGNAAYVLKDKVRLRNVALRLTAMSPDRHEGYMFRGVIQTIDGNPTAAITSFDQAILRTTTDATPLILKGLALQDLGKLDEARDTYVAAIKIDPTGPGQQALQALGGATGFATHPNE